MLELNEVNFVEETSQGLVLVDFWAPWCGPCRALSPVLEQLQNITVAKVNIDENMDLAAQYSVSSIPCLVFLRDGVEMDRVVGLQSKEVLQETVDALGSTLD